MSLVLSAKFFSVYYLSKKASFLFVWRYFYSEISSSQFRNAGDMGLNPGLGRSPGGGHGKPLQFSCLDNPMDRGAWWATVHGAAESDTAEAT